LAAPATNAAQEIRSGDITREEAWRWSSVLNHEFPLRFINELFRYLSIDEKEFPEASRMFEHPIVDIGYFKHLDNSFRSPHLWQWDGKEWSLRHAVWHESQTAA